MGEDLDHFDRKCQPEVSFHMSSGFKQLILTNTSDNQPISSKEAIYHFQFDEAAPDRDDTYGGYLADEVIQEKLPEDDGINLSLNGLKANKWHRGRCVITLLPKDDVNKTAKEPTKRYTS
ncbi:unnamed protein product, partial [Trichobilharzia regenti]